MRWAVLLLFLGLVGCGERKIVIEHRHQDTVEEDLENMKSMLEASFGVPYELKDMYQLWIEEHGKEKADEMLAEVAKETGQDLADIKKMADAD